MVSPTCPPRWRGAFLGEPRMVTLPPGERLYKMVSLPVDRQRVLASPWWIRQQDFADLLLRARRLQRPVADLIRARLAVAEEWNPGMDVLWIAQLATVVPAWEGRACAQPQRLADRTVLLIGGGSQVCVPDLTWQHIAVDFAANVGG